MIGILTDITKCVGCRRCVKACQSENNCPQERPEHKALQEELFNSRWTTIINRPQQHFVRRHCRHCLKPSCVSACPVGALQKTKKGPIIYDKKKCIGCRYCMIACPYGIPRYNWNSLAPGVAKCTFCFHRIVRDKQPACTEVCPTKATVFGERKDLLILAKKTISENPKKYLPKIYGEHEIGGTSILYISDIPLSFLTFASSLGTTPPALRSWDMLKLTPAIAGGVAFSVGGIQWIINRRIKLQKKNKKEKN